MPRSTVLVPYYTKKTKKLPRSTKPLRSTKSFKQQTNAKEYSTQSRSSNPPTSHTKEYQTKPRSTKPNQGVPNLTK